MAHAHALRENSGMITGIAALSAAVGALTALMLTPRTGEQLRGGIKQRAMSAKDTVTQKFERTKDDATEAAEEIKTKTQRATAAAKQPTTRSRARKSVAK